MRPESWQSFTDFSDLNQLRQRFLKNPFSFLLYGPAGTGKTTFIELLLAESGHRYHTLPSTATTLEELRKIVYSQSSKTIIFMDEFHRFSKSRQDFFLKPLEDGTVILIAATTESPWYYFTRPLLSRLFLKQITLPSEKTFQEIIQTSWQAQFKPLPEQVLQQACAGTCPDFRAAYQTLETLSVAQKNGYSSDELLELLDKLFQENRYYRKDFTTYQYDLLSAFIKSVRGTAPDAAILYLAKMLELGIDPALIARRLVILAAEDIGLANSQALVLAEAGFSSIEKIGMPEARIILSEITLYLAASPKSNSAYLAIDKALAFVKGKDIMVPEFLRNTSVQKKKYEYVHDHGGYSRQNYWPAHLEAQPFYEAKKTVFENSNESKVKQSIDLVKNKQ